MKTLVRVADELQEFVAQLDADCYDGVDAARMAEVTARGERLLAVAKAMFADRAVRTGGWRRVSHAASPEQWLAGLSGSSEGAARDTLTTADRLRELPATEAKLRAGELSLTQANLVAAGAAVDPAAESQLLKVAERAPVHRLRKEQQRVVTAASDESRLRRIAHRDRHLRTWTQGLATHGSFSGPTTEVAKLLDALEPLAEHRFEHARKTERHESRDAYRFDALIDLADGATVDAATAKPVVRVRVDATALLRGHTEPGETCEIPGLGPVPVSDARALLSHGLLELVLSDGVDVQAVVSRTRHIPLPLRVAIEERDHGRCQIDRCDRTYETERHHVVAYVEGRLTTYDILVTVCPEHHDLIHHRGYTIVENPDGTYSLRAPPHTSAA